MKLKEERDRVVSLKFDRPTHNHPIKLPRTIHPSVIERQCSCHQRLCRPEHGRHRKPESAEVEAVRPDDPAASVAAVFAHPPEQCHPPLRLSLRESMARNETERSNLK